MRKINPRDFRVARRSTSRDINRRIALNLVQEHQPISRADLARHMSIGRGVVSVLINELISEGLIYEGVTGEAARGRRPTFLHVKTHDRLVVAIDVRFSHTDLMLSDFSGRQIALETFKTNFDPAQLTAELAERIRRLLKTHNALSNCEGIGLVVPGMVDHHSGLVLNAPTLGWRDVDLRDHLAALTGLPVQVENAAKACALAQMWLGKNEIDGAQNFAFVSVSDGVGVGMVINGELVRGQHNIAGEFGHAPLNIDGPRCLCGATGCWETYISNIATLSRYFVRDSSKIISRDIFSTQNESFTINDLIARARSGDARAITTLQSTGRYLGLGLATVLNIFNPNCVFIGGEITAAWDLINDNVLAALSERALTGSIAATTIRIAAASDYPRLRGAAALVAAPTFAAPRVA